MKAPFLNLTGGETARLESDGGITFRRNGIAFGPKDTAAIRDFLVSNQDDRADCIGGTDCKHDDDHAKRCPPRKSKDGEAK